MFARTFSFSYLPNESSFQMLSADYVLALRAFEEIRAILFFQELATYRKVHTKHFPDHIVSIYRCRHLESLV
jgi:hypothetical protein